jgi:hypothetical protein
MYLPDYLMLYFKSGITFKNKSENRPGEHDVYYGLFKGEPTADLRNDLKTEVDGSLQSYLLYLYIVLIHYT